MSSMSTWPPSLERLRGTIGVWTFAPETVVAAQSGDVAAELESLGYAALWVPEAWGREAFTSAGLMLGATSSMIVATGIANIWARDAVAANSAAKTLNAAYADRFVLGLGVSHRPLVERLRGHEYASPVAAMREYLSAMEGAPMRAPEGELRYAKVIAALGPKMLEVGATLADGVHPYLVTPEHTAQARARVGDKFVGVEQAVVLDQSREEYLQRAHAHLGFYTGLENYTNSWRRLGFGDEDFVRGGSERLCEALVIHGDEEAVLERVNQHRAAGADHVCLQVLSDETNAPPYEEWRRLSAILPTTPS
jgi:probable F420-dependent oxidoreductase